MAPRPFAARLRCIPVSKFAERGKELEAGGKIILPPSVLDKLTRFDEVLNSPMLFKLINTKMRMFSNCGVLEFTADEGHVYLPRW
jgi:ubiquitin fusion degradation protein 1